MTDGPRGGKLGANLGEAAAVDLLNFVQTLGSLLSDSALQFVVRSPRATQVFVREALTILEPAHKLITQSVPAFSKETFALYELSRDSKACGYPFLAVTLQQLVRAIDFDREPNALGTWSPTSQRRALDLLEISLTLLTWIYITGSDKDGAVFMHRVNP